MAASRQCKATKRGGRRCTAYAITGRDYCLTHDPESAEVRAQRNRRGGRARTLPKVSGEAVQIVDVATVLQLVNKVILDTWEQENSAPRSRALLSAADMAIKALQIGELEERVKRLEQVIAEKKT